MSSLALLGQAGGFLGESACLGAALCWALAVTLFRGPIETYGAWTVNLVRSFLGGALLTATAIALGQATAVTEAPLASLGLVALSGIVGLTLGDTALFAAVGRLGVHRTLLFQTLGPVFAALLEIGVYGTLPAPGELLGAAVVLAGVAVVVAPDHASARSADDEEDPPGRPLDPAGVALAILAAFGQAAGIVLAKDGMEGLPLVASSAVRLLAAAVGMLLVMAWSKRLRRVTPSIVRGALRAVAGPTLLGTYFAFLLMMAGIAWAPASVAAVLLGTSPIFSLFLDRWTVRAPLTAHGLVGTFLAVLGVGVLAFAGG